MKINRMIVIGLVATSLLASCKKNNGTEANAPENGFRATIEQPAGNGSRTHINPDWANDASTNVLWTAADLIKVANGNGTVLNYEITEGENTSNGVFYTGEENEDFFQPNYAAIYPAFNADDVANTISSTTATFNMPQTQTYRANSFAEKSMPMVAYSTDQTLAFKNVFGGICIPLVGDGLTVTRIVLTSANASEHLYGTFTADCTSATPAPTYVSGGGNSVTLDCSATPVTLDANNPTYFCFMVPPASLASGFTVEAFNGTSRIFNASTSANPNITRSVISKVSNSLEVVVTPLTVTTISPTFISTNSALGIGTASGGTPTESGVVYALASALATPADDLVIGGTGVTSVSATAATSYDTELTGLQEDKVYYVRAWAKNEAGIAYYGDPIPFATRYDYYGLRDGKSRFAFTVKADGTQVYFSMGNLQYQGSTSTWRFAEYQFEYVGDANVGNVYSNGQHPNSSLDGTKSDNALIAQYYSGWIDQFGWGTSGYNHGATCWQPWSTSTDYSQYNPYGSTSTNLNSNSGQADWGYNAISNGGNQAGDISGRIAWRTLQDGTNGGNTAEWNYLFNTRTCTYRYAHAQLTNVRRAAATSGTTINGMILFPDSFEWPALAKSITTNSNTSFGAGSNQLTEAEWSLLEQAGAVFLPAAGYRNGTTVYSAGFDGRYWSSTYSLSHSAYDQNFRSDVVSPQYSDSRHRGYSVRLVCPAE